jgi:Ca-activated chloride channel homolog
MSPSAWPLNLSDPVWLAGLLALPLLVWYHHRSLVDFPRWQRLLALACRSLFIALLVLALTGLTWRVPTGERFVVFLIDRSQSVGEEARQVAEDFLDKALAPRGRHRAAFLEFAAEPGPVTPQRVHPTGPPPEDETALGTDLAAAVEVAAGAVPPGYVPQLVLLSDGNQTIGDVLKAVLRAGLPVSTVPLPQREEPQVQVSEVRVEPQEVREGQPFAVEVVIHSNHDDEGVLELFCSGRPVPGVREVRRKIKKGENRIRIDHPPLVHENVAVFLAQIKGFDDRRLDDNSARALVYCAGKPRVLIVDSDPKQIDHLARALEEEGIQVDPPRPPQGVPDSLAELQNYELLVLSNVPATALTQRQMELIRLYVRDLGGGLLTLGGDQAFGLGGYSRSLLEDLLPVHSDLKREKEKPSLAMVLVIDRSGSMQGQKIEMAKEAARAAVELLGPNDKIGIIAFDAEWHWISEMHPCSDKAYVLDRISRIEANGGTRILPALEAAYEALVGLGATARYKHIILLTDGIDNVSGPGEFLDQAGRMSAARLTLTTVGVGVEADKNLLEQMARAGGGRNYQVDDPASVPQVFAKETVEASKDAIQEQPFVPVLRRPTPVLAGLDWQDAKFLHGYVTTREKATSETVLVTTPKFDPLLAWWRTGLGMSVAFTADAKPKWADEWITDWPGGFSKFWAQVVRHAMRKNEARGVEVQVAQRGRRALVTVDALDALGRFLNDAETEVNVIGPQRDLRTVALRQTAPGRYAAEFETPYPGEYHLQITQKQDGRLRFQQTRGLSVGYPDELRLRPTNEELLQTLARVSGGTYRPAPEEAFLGPATPAGRTTPLWPYLLAAAAVLLVVDVALRRIDLSPVLAACRFAKRQAGGRPFFAGPARAGTAQ